MSQPEIDIKAQSPDLTMMEKAQSPGLAKMENDPISQRFTEGLYTGSLDSPMTDMDFADRRKKQRVRPGSGANKNPPASHLGRLYNHKEEQSPSTPGEGKRNKSATRPLSFMEEDPNEDMPLSKAESPGNKFVKQEPSDISGQMQFSPFIRNAGTPDIEGSAFQIKKQPEDSESKSKTPKSKTNLVGKSPRGSNRFLPGKSPLGSGMNISVKRARVSQRN